jgi:HPt (histidine-containing phosphotransfer) domain-containing protein
MNDRLVKPVEIQALAATTGKWLKLADKDLPAATLSNDPQVNGTPGDSGGAVPVFDRPALLERTMNDPEFAREVLKAFSKDLPVQVAQLKRIAETPDLKSAAQQAHKIKGAAANVGGKALWGLLMTLEKSANSGDKETFFARLNDWDPQVEALLAAVKAELSESS